MLDVNKQAWKILVSKMVIHLQILHQIQFLFACSKGLMWGMHFQIDSRRSPVKCSRSWGPSNYSVLLRVQFLPMKFTSFTEKIFVRNIRSPFLLSVVYVMMLSSEFRMEKHLTFSAYPFSFLHFCSCSYLLQLQGTVSMWEPSLSEPT